MDIYVVQPGDTIFSIAEKYHVPVERLVYDNNLPPNYTLVNGQLILITHPEQTYQVQPGDTIQSIATAFGITMLQLLQNNPFLADRDYLNVGEELIITFSKNEKSIDVNAYVFSYVNEEVLRKALLFLTYITIVGYTITASGSIIAPTDSNIIEMAKEYGVAPIMMLSTFTEQGRGSYGITYKILNDLELQNVLIENILSILREKGLTGINFGFQYVLPDDLPKYITLIANTKEKLREEGYQVIVTLIPKTFGYKVNDNSDNPYYSQIGQIADSVILLSYQWTIAYIPAFEQTAIPYLKSYAEYVISQIPPEKIFISFTRIAYSWELPYVEGESAVFALANLDAIKLASQVDTTMGFDEYYMTPYYYYYDGDGIQHFVWFKDARTFTAITDLVIQYNLKGISIWNVMDYTPQLWVALNSQFFTPKILNVTSQLLTNSPP